MHADAFMEDSMRQVGSQQNCGYIVFIMGQKDEKLSLTFTQHARGHLFRLVARRTQAVIYTQVTDAFCKLRTHVYVVTLIAVCNTRQNEDIRQTSKKVKKNISRTYVDNAITEAFSFMARTKQRRTYTCLISSQP